MFLRYDTRNDVDDTLNNNLNSRPQFIYDSAGKITGYKTKGGADTVFPFKSATITNIYTTQGEGGTINVTNIAKDYRNLSVNNFIIEPIYGYSVNGGYWTGKSNYWSSAFSKSYDNQTGIFTYRGLYTAQTVDNAGGLICNIFLIE